MEADEPPGQCGSGSQEMDEDGGHQLRTFFGYSVCLNCFQYANEIKGKHRGLGSECSLAKSTAAQAERKRKAEKIMLGVSPRGGKPLG